MRNRIAITGIGMVSPLGINQEKVWENLMACQSVAGPITSLDTTGYEVTFGCEVRDFNPDDFISKKDARKMDKFLIYALSAAQLAVKDSGIDFSALDPYATGTLIGSGIGGMISIQNQDHNLIEKGPDKVSPFFIPMSIINMASGQVAMHYGIKGPSFSVVSACATGLHSIGIAANLIAQGTVKIMVTGGSEAGITPLSLAGFSSMKALSCRNQEPHRASRPFDKERDGFVIAEGAGVLILEEWEHARQRGAKIYGELVGFGMSADAYHITFPDPEGAGAEAAMNMALRDASLNPQDIDYINAHGTATPVGDKIETLAIKKVFKEHAPKIPVSSTKSIHGHLLGAAGAMESIICLLAMKHNIIPPTINYEFPDPECDLDYVPNHPRNANLTHVMNNSFGFGGQNAVIIYKKA